MAEVAPPPPPQDTDADILFRAQRDPETRLLLERALKAEGNDPNVLYTILNRARQSGQSVKDVLLTRGQFTSLDPKIGTPGLSSLTEAQLGPEAALIANPPGWGKFNPNMTYFYNPELLAKKHAEDPKDYPNITPKFAMGRSPVASSGHQLFFEGQYKGGPLMATSTATGPTASPTVNAAIDAQPFSGLPQMSPEDTERMQKYRGQAEAMEPEVVADIQAMGPEYDKQLTQLQQWQDAANAAHDRFSQSAQSLIDNLPDEHKMQAEELHKVSDQPNDPTRVFGQFLPMLAVLGGAFTKAGAVGSLNAAAAAMNAARGHDEDALKRANEMFHDKLQETMDSFNIAHTELGEELAKAQGNQEAVLQAGQIVGLKHGINALVQASYNGQADAIWANYMNGAKAYSELAGAQAKGLKYQMDMLKYQEAMQAFNDGKSLTDAQIWTLAVANNNGAPAPPMAWSDVELKRKFAQYKAEALENPSWNGPWGIGPDPSAGVTGGTAPTAPTGGQPAPAGGKPAAAGGQPAPAAGAGLSPTEAGVEGATVLANVKADRSSLANITKLADASHTQENAALQNFDLALSKAPKGVVLNWGPWIENWIQGGAAAIGNQDVPPYQVALLTAADEYAKIISGATGAAGATAESRKQAIDMFKPGYTVGQMTNVINTVKQDMANRVGSYAQQRAEIEGRLKNERGEAGGQAPAAPTAAPQPQGLTKESDRQLWTTREQQFIEAAKKGTLHKEYTPAAIKAKFREWFPDATDAAINRAVATIEAARPKVNAH